jgi:hypothetical protein
VTGRGPLEVSRLKWKDNEADVNKTGYEVVDWVCLAQDIAQCRAFVNIIMNVRFEVITAVIMKSIVF